MCTTVVVIALAAEYTQNGVSVVTATLWASGGSTGPLPQPWPIALLSTTLPSYRRHNWIAGCMPARYQCRTACQMRSTAAESISEWSSSATAVTASRSAGTRILPSAVMLRLSCVRPVQRRGQVVLKWLPDRTQSQCVGQFVTVDPNRTAQCRHFFGRRRATDRRRRQLQLQRRSGARQCSLLDLGDAGRMGQDQ